MYFTPDGHSVSLRKVLEAELRNYEQGEPSKKLGRVTRLHGLSWCTAGLN